LVEGSSGNDEVIYDILPMLGSEMVIVRLPVDGVVVTLALAENK
jgi:hypothetical protein